MSPRIEREAAMDDMGDYAVAQPIVSSVASWLADAREIQRRLTAQAAKDVDHAYYRWLAEQLLEKLHGAQRALDAGVYTRSLNREPLEGMLLVDTADDREAAAPALTFERIAPRFIPGQQEQTR